MSRTASTAAPLVLALSLAALGGCQKRIEPPGTPGVCYHVTFKGEELVYDYHTDGEQVIKCHCRPNCKRWL